MKQFLGALLLDAPRYVWALARGGRAYLSVHNRNEALEPAPKGMGFRCVWQWTSELHAPKILPALGRWLMRNALRDTPIVRAKTPPFAAPDPHPDVTFVIGHRGQSRLPHLLATLESIAAQRDVTIECIVVEQDTESQLVGRLPTWVRHIHLPPPRDDLPYCRSWTFNVAADQARGRILILHDNDMLVPSQYASRVVERVASGFAVVNLKRFVFYLSESHTNKVFSGDQNVNSQPPESIIQNLEGGGSVAITAEAFAHIGGMDEAFVGWGGEDNEFWERAGTLAVWPYGELPIVHLWHAAQPRKQDADNPTLKLYADLARTPAAQRIAALRARQRGSLHGPSSSESLATQPNLRESLNTP